MKGGVILFRGTGIAARRYLESDRSTADEYYLEGGTALADFAASGHDGEVIDNENARSGRLCCLGRLDRSDHRHLDGNVPIGERQIEGVAALRRGGHQRTEVALHRRCPAPGSLRRT